MKLITLNTWGGRSLYPLIEFFKKHGESTDVFCLQEIFDADQDEIDARHPGQHVHGPLFQKICEALPDFNGTFATHEDNPHRMSLALLVRRTIPVQVIDDFIVYQPRVPKETGSAVISSRKLQHVTIVDGGREYTIVNFHGLWVNGPKTDTPERIEQANMVKEFLGGISGPKILCGDFNLLPDTGSMHILESGMRNLVKEFNVGSTRTPLYRHYKNPKEPNFADYILVSQDVSVKEFGVLPDLVSDHAPLFLEFT